jgi:hypothetical protein
MKPIEQVIEEAGRRLHVHFCECEHPIPCARSALPILRALVAETVKRCLQAVADEKASWCGAAVLPSTSIVLSQVVLRIDKEFGAFASVLEGREGE